MTGDLPGKRESFWIDGIEAPSFSPLTGHHTTDVAIVGGGIVGLTAAVLLKQAGQSVAVLEARRVAQQVSGRTTAKITSQHNLIYKDLIQQYGEEAARTYALSNQAALDRIERFVRELGIDCQYEHRSAYTYSLSETMIETMQAEAEAAVRLGLPASFTRQAPLPYSISGAVRFDGQAQFQPYRYLLGLAARIPGGGSAIFEQTRVLDVDEGEPCTIRTDRGTLNARHVIVATNLPILDRGGFFARAFPMAHMMIAAPLEEESKAPDGMFISADTPSHSFRTARQDGKLYLVAVGETFTTGHRSDTGKRIRSLEEFLRSKFPVGPVAYRWMNEDYRSMDTLPFIGPLTPASTYVWTATGFNAWGMTNGTLAAMILADRIQDRNNPWADLYDSSRINLDESAGKFARENLHAGTHFVEGRLASRPKDPSGLKPGEGDVFDLNGDPVAVHRDANGHLHACSAICTHMRCTVTWNEAESTWDCPCHGSRFDAKGQVLHGPAVSDLETKPPVSGGSQHIG